MIGRVKRAGNEIDPATVRCELCRFYRDEHCHHSPPVGGWKVVVAAADFCGQFVEKESAGVQEISLDRHSPVLRRTILRRWLDDGDVEIVCESDADRELLERVRK
jgi:uncharacterized protein (DUF2237 family)